MESIITNCNSAIATEPAFDSTITGSANEFNRNTNRVIPGIKEEFSNEAMAELFSRIANTVRLQAEEWRAKPFYQREWICRQFKKVMGFPLDQYLLSLDKLSSLQEINPEDALIKSETRNKMELRSEILCLYEKDTQKGSAHTHERRGWF